MALALFNNLNLHRRTVFTWAVIALIVIASTFSYFHYKKPAPILLKSAAISGGAKGDGARYQYPISFTRLEPLNSSAIASYEKDTSPGNTLTAVAGMSVSSTPAEPYFSYDLNYGFSVPANPINKAVTQPIVDFIKSQITYIFFFGQSPAKTQTKITAYNKISTPVFFSNGLWVVDYTAKGEDGALVKGEMAVAAGSHNKYYLLVGSLSAHWQADQTVWKKIIYGLKIDQ